MLSSVDEALLALAQLPHLIWVCDSEHAYGYVSPQWQSYTGVSEAALLGHGWLDSVHPDDRHFTMLRWQEAARSENPYGVECRILRHDGEYRWFKGRASPFRDESGRVVRWYGSYTDIQDLDDVQSDISKLNQELEHYVELRTTELRKANELLTTSAQQLSQAQSITHVGSWSFELEGNRLEWSEELFRIVGLEPRSHPPSAEEQAARFTESSWQQLTRAIGVASSTGEGCELELIVVRPGGEERFVQVRCEAIRNEAGQVKRLLGTLQDVTELTRARRERDASEERARLATASARLGIFDWDVQNDVLVWDEQLHRILDVPLDLTPSYAYWETRVHPDDLEGARRSLNEAMETSNELDMAFRVCRDDGVVTHIHCSAEIFRDDEDKVFRILGVNWDVTRQRELDLLLQRQKEDLERSNRDLEQFAYAASHDLQEPLRAVAGCAQILRELYRGRLDASADELIDHVVAGADRMRTLILDLLAYSRVGTRVQSLSLVSSLVAVADARANLATAITETAATLEIEPLPEVYADLGQLTLLFQNLIGNALKYRSARPPHLRIRAEKHDDEIRFSVSDNGIGIEEQYFQRIFVLFQRLHGRGEYSGTGIGLALCQRIVERHDGRIWVESTPGEGSTFWFSLPTREPSPTEGHELLNESTLPATPRRR